MCVDPKSAKMTVKVIGHVALLGFTHIKAVQKYVGELSPRAIPIIGILFKNQSSPIFRYFTSDH